MKLSKDQKQSIIQLKNQGFPSRFIAKELGIGKSTVNDYWHKYNSDIDNLEVQVQQMPNILVYDLETAAATAMTFGRFNINLSQSNIVDEGGWILCASFKWLGSDEQTTLHLTPEEIYNRDDSRIVAELYTQLENASATIAHNNKKFDSKVLQTRALVNGFGALPTVKIIDTLQMAKAKLKLPSNKLDSIGEYFGLGRKIETEGITLWKKVQDGDMNAMVRMVKYCEQDVVLLEAVYNQLRCLGNTGSGYNAALQYNDGQVHCPTCSSTDLVPTGRVVNTSVSSFYEVECLECGSKHRTRQNILQKEQRKGILQAL